MVKLGVNIDHVATLRQARLGSFPDPLQAAMIIQSAGGQGITLHLREDRRHIQDHDVLSIRKKIKIPLNLEMAATPAMVRFALKARPQQVCLVPEKRRELTTEGGLEIVSQVPDLRKKISALKKDGIRVSLFIDPDLMQIRASKDAGADCVELHTGTYADAETDTAKKKEFKKLIDGGREALRLGLILNAGHGLDYENVEPVAKIEGMNELNIGFSIIGRALFVGLDRAVREMKELIF